MTRKTGLTISVLLIAVDLAVTAALLNAGAHRLGAAYDGVAAVTELVHKFLRPLPHLVPPL